jgi:hypothetical protein
VKTRAEKTGRNISKNTTIKIPHTTFLLSNLKVFVEGVKQITKQNILIIKSKRLCQVVKKERDIR